MIQVKPYIAGSPKYSPPWTRMDRSEYLRFDLNEYTLNTPDHVVRGLQKAVQEKGVQMYPDYGAFMPKLAGYADVPEDHLIVTNGSDQAIEIILRAFLAAGDPMVIAEPGFPMFPLIAGIIGARVRGVPYEGDYSFPLEAFINAVTADTRIIVVINPNNPTGAGVSREAVEKIVERFPDIPVVIDEAYYEFTGETALDLLSANPNVIITRTFSKAFAMAGLRMGYIIAHPDIITQFHKIRGPFDVNSLALAAAETQIDHPEEWKAFVDETMNRSKPCIEKFFDENGVTYYKGAAHFMLVEPANRDEAVQFLKTKGILVRPMTAPGIEQTFRMSIGTLEQTRRFADVYRQYLETL